MSQLNKITPTPRPAAWVPYLLFAVLHLANVLVAARLPFPVDIDEEQHLSYVLHVRDTGEVWTDYSELKVYRDVCHRCSYDYPNWLEHPSTYYWLMAPLVADNLQTTVARMRQANILLSLLALVVASLGALMIFREPLHHLLFVAVLALYPKIGFVGGLINNDNLALLAGALCFTGTASVVTGRSPGWGTALVAVALALAGLSKLSAFVMLGTAVAVVALGTWRRWWQWSLLVAGALTGGLPYLVNLVRFGRLLPGTRLGSELPPADPNAAIPLVTRPPVPVPFADSWAYLSEAAELMVLKWPMAEGQFTVIGGLSVVLMLGLATRALTRPRPTRWLPLGALLALAATLTVNLAYLYLTRTGDGVLLGISPRYYAPLWPFVAAAAALGLSTGAKSRIVAATVIALCFVGTTTATYALTLAGAFG